MPKSSMTMTEGELVKWVVAEGDEVQAGDPVAEIMTDKVEMEVEAPEDGRMGILVEAGRTVDVGTTIGVILAEGEKAPAVGTPTSPQPSVRDEPVGVEDSAARPRPAEPPGAPVDTPLSGDGRGGRDGRLRASPAARKMARNRGIDLAGLRGSGPKGRITTEDVAAASNHAERNKAAPVRTGDGRGSGLGRKRPTGVRGAMARRMGAAGSIPQFTLFADVSFAAAERARRELSKAWSVRLSVTHLVVRATAIALQGHGALNAHWADGTIERFADANVGVAMATDAGLIVPVLHVAQSADLRTTSQRVAELAQAAGLNRLRPEEMAGATFTVTNLGAFGIDIFQPVIDPPQVAILSVGRMRGDAGRTVTLGLAADHRAVDGVQGARFLMRLAELIERPDKELLH